MIWAIIIAIIILILYFITIRLTNIFVRSLFAILVVVGILMFMYWIGEQNMIELVF